MRGELTSDALIVDFPFGRSTTTKSVHFSPKPEVLYIPFPSEEEVTELWYTKEDQHGFKIRVIRDAKKCSRMLDAHSKQSNKICNTDLLCHCVGLYHLISRDIRQSYETLQTERKEHTKSIMDELHRQSSCGRSSSWELARVSCASSRPAGKRSHKIAILVRSID